jgi:hypothetical protein
MQDQAPDMEVAATPSSDVEVVGLKHFKRLMPLLHRLDQVGCERDTAGNRRLFMSGYCATVLLYLFNPMINSLRMLQETLQLPHVFKTLGVRRFSLGSFSESVRVFDPHQLKGITGSPHPRPASVGSEARPDFG